MSRRKKNKSIGRITIIDDERNLILGKELDNILDKGVVYDIIKVGEEFILREAGESGLPDKGYPSKNSDVNTIVNYGDHLLTKREIFYRENFINYDSEKTRKFFEEYNKKNKK